MDNWRELIRCILLTITPFLFMVVIDHCIKREEPIIITDEEIEELVNLITNIRIEKDLI